MKESELRKHTTCNLCGKKIGHTGLPLFWTVKVEWHGINMNAVRVQDGLAAMLGGNAGLAQVMGTYADVMEAVEEMVKRQTKHERNILHIP